MRHPLLLVPVLVLLVAAVAAACGGSSSETPWPVEPEASQLGPTAESATPPSITLDRLDGGSRRKAP
jgi:hypothetical protein